LDKTRRLKIRFSLFITHASRLKIEILAIKWSKRRLCLICHE
jgi:hypothetical protein